MAEISDSIIREAITERLKATHVEVTDMSGTLRPEHTRASTLEPLTKKKPF